MCFTFLSQEYEDAHGQTKSDLSQQILLPHEIVDCFIREGELRRMIGDGDFRLILHQSSNTCYVCRVFLNLQITFQVWDQIIFHQLRTWQISGP